MEVGMEMGIEVVAGGGGGGWRGWKVGGWQVGGWQVREMAAVVVDEGVAGGGGGRLSGGRWE